jgi:hypothetical protein
MRKSIFLICLFSLSWAKIFAQLNESDSLHLQIKFTSTGSLLDGNVSRMVFLNKLEVARANEKSGFSTRNDYQYGTTRKILTENDFLSYNFLYLHPLAKIYPYWMALIETNYRRNIFFRYQTGPGVTWNAVRQKDNLLKISLTGTYENTRYGGTTFDDERYNGLQVIETWRITGRIFGKHKIFKEKLRLSYEFWWQQSVQDANNYRFHTEESLELPVSKHFSFRTGFRYSYENIELAGLKPFDLFWTYGIAIANF